MKAWFSAKVEPGSCMAWSWTTSLFSRDVAWSTDKEQRLLRLFEISGEPLFCDKIRASAFGRFRILDCIFLDLAFKSLDTTLTGYRFYYYVQVPSRNGSFATIIISDLGAQVVALLKLISSLVNWKVTWGHLSSCKGSHKKSSVPVMTWNPN